MLHSSGRNACFSRFKPEIVIHKFAFAHFMLFNLRILNFFWYINWAPFSIVTHSFKEKYKRQAIFKAQQCSIQLAFWWIFWLLVFSLLILWMGMQVVLHCWRWLKPYLNWNSFEITYGYLLCRDMKIVIWRMQNFAICLLVSMKLLIKCVDQKRFEKNWWTIQKIS